MQFTVCGKNQQQTLIIPEKTLTAGRRERDETAAVHRCEQTAEHVRCQLLQCLSWSKHQHISVDTVTTTGTWNIYATAAATNFTLTTIFQVNLGYLFLLGFLP